MTFSGLKRIPRPARTPAAQAWLDEEAREQRARYAAIAREMNVTRAAQRELWIDAFNERIQTRGFNVHADIRRKIKPAEIYPKRDIKVVF